MSALECSEEIGDDRKVRPLRIGKEQGGTSGGDHSTVNLGDLEPRIDLSLHLDEVAASPEEAQELAQVLDGLVSVHAESVSRVSRSTKEARCGTALAFP